MKRLITIQQGLRVTKDKSGDGGRFKFRSAEDIFEKAKPFLAETNTAVVVTDELTEIGGRCAIKATATLYGDKGAIASASGWACMDSHVVSGVDRAGNAYTKKTMSNEQCTGSASSYARKYALCGLFAIDNDENDPDQPNIQPAPKQPEQQPQKPAQQPTKPAPQKPAPQSAKTAKGATSAAPKEPAQDEPLNHDEIAAYMAICADIDASDSLEQIKANAERARGTRYAKKANAHAIKIATEKGWYNPQNKQ
jgi:hypothetical protein